MITLNKNTAKKKQAGIVLLALIIAIALTASVYYFSSISIVDIQVDNLEKTRTALKKAKAALINYAITHANGNGSGDAGEYGYLPCPDSSTASGEGSDPSCGTFFKNRLGYFPWKSVGLKALKDGSGSCLWYAISGSYKGENIEQSTMNYFKQNTGLLNEDTNGLFQIVGGASDVVAVIFAPGAVLDGQSRNIDINTHCGEDYGNQVAYLEGDGVTDNSNVPDVVNSPDQFIQATLTSSTEPTPYNDYFVTITRQEIWQAITLSSDFQNLISEVTEALALCLAEYVNHADNPEKRVPWPSPMDIDGGDYRIMSNYSDMLNATSGYAGRFPFNIDGSNTALTAATGLADDVVDDAICSSLNVTISGVVTVNLNNKDSAHRIMLNNWKDHFFYATSKDYSFPDVAYTGCTGNCVAIGGTDYAAIIFYSGSPYTALPQLRNATDKIDISNYLENGNDAVFTDAGGNGAYTTTDIDPSISNDVIFCLTDAPTPSIVAC